MSNRASVHMRSHHEPIVKVGSPLNRNAVDNRKTSLGFIQVVSNGCQRGVAPTHGELHP